MRVSKAESIMARQYTMIQHLKEKIIQKDHDIKLMKQELRQYKNTKPVSNMEIYERELS